MSVDRAESVEELESLGATWILDGMVSKKGERRDGRELYQKKVRTLCTFPTNDQRRICEKFSPWNSLQPLDEKTSRVHVETVSGRRRHNPLLLRHPPIAAHTCRYPWIMDLNPPPRWLSMTTRHRKQWITNTKRRAGRERPRICPILLTYSARSPLIRRKSPGWMWIGQR